MHAWIIASIKGSGSIRSMLDDEDFEVIKQKDKKDKTRSN